MDFKKITDALFTRITSEDLATEAKVSWQAVRQARMAEGANSKRPPPPGWEDAALRLAERQATQFTKLAAKLRAAQKRAPTE